MHLCISAVFRPSRALPLAASALAGIVFAGCAGVPDADRAVVLDAFDAEGRTSTRPEDLASPPANRPVIVRFAEGDEVVVVTRIDAPGRLERSGDAAFRATRDFEVMYAPQGVYVRDPGGDWERVHGRLEVGFGLDAETRRNELSVGLAIED